MVICLCLFKIFFRDINNFATNVLKCEYNYSKVRSYEKIRYI